LVSGIKGKKQTVGVREQGAEEVAENCIVMSFITCTLRQTIRIIKSGRMRWEGHAACMREKWDAYRVLVGKPADKRPLGRPRRVWEDNIKMDFREIVLGGMDLIDLAQDRHH
jgi:hypothetical protein